jgi:hypothetical protein
MKKGERLNKKVKKEVEDLREGEINRFVEDKISKELQKLIDKYGYKRVLVSVAMKSGQLKKGE